MTTNAPYVRCAIPVPVDRLFDYRVPESLRPDAEPGRRVRVPFGRQVLLGYVVERAETTEVPATAMKDVIEVVDPEPVVIPALASQPTAVW